MEESTDPAAIDWEGCGEGVECAQVDVPLNWADPEGATLSLAVIRHPVRDPEQKIGTLFFNPGGPGESGVAAVRSGADELAEWGGGRFDVVAWDPRGAAGTSPIDCFEDATEREAFWTGVELPATLAQSEEFEGTLAGLVARCTTTVGDALAHMSTADDARDLDRLRALVGDTQLTYVRLSWGTLIGQTYANLFPENVRAMVLDGVVDPIAFTGSAESRAASGVSSVTAVVDEFLTLCDAAGPAKCALAKQGESAAARLQELLERTTTGADGQGLTSTQLGTAITTTMSAPSSWPALADALEAGVSGDTTALEAIAAQLSSPEVSAQLTVAAGIGCADAGAEQSLADWPEVVGPLTADSPLAGAFQGWWIWGVCAAGWPESPGRYDGPWDAVTEHPLLLIGTRFDPNTSYANAVAAEKLLGNAVLLTLDGYGHISVSDPSACVAQARTRYLVELATPTPGTVCEPDQPPFG